MQPKARGRPRRKEDLVRVWLRKSVYSLWKEKKDHVGFSKNTNSEFAGYLLTCVGRSVSKRRRDLVYARFIYMFVGVGENTLSK